MEFDVKKWIEEIKKMPLDEQKRLKEELKAVMKELKVRSREKTEIPHEAKALMEMYWQLKTKLEEIRKKLYEEFGLTPQGTKVKRGYGDYNYRNTPAYETVKEIIKNYRTISIEKLEEELKARGYKGITGTIGVVLKNLREDGLIERSGGGYIWLGEST